VRIDRKDVGNVTILAFAGEIDTVDLAVAKRETDAVLEDGCDRLILNLGRLQFLNSSALAYLISLHKRVRSLGGELAFSEPSTFFRTTIRHLGLEREFSIFPDDQAALQHLGRGESA
jgi:anti-sigma B factor antagonist